MRILRKIVTFPTIVVCLVAVGYYSLRIALSSHRVAEAVRSRIAQELHCDVRLGRATLNPMGLLALENLTLRYRKADGMHEVFKSDYVEVEFDPTSFLESRLRLMSLKFTGAALSLERDSEGWLTLGRIVRPVKNPQPMSLVVEAKDSAIRCADVCIPVEFVRAEVSRSSSRLDVCVTDGALLGGEMEGSGSIQLEEDPTIRGTFRFTRISLPRLFRENREPVLDVQGEATCEIRIEGRASSSRLLGQSSRLVIHDFSVSALGPAESATPTTQGFSPPSFAAKVLELKTSEHPTSIPIPEKPNPSERQPTPQKAMELVLTVEKPEITLLEVVPSRFHPELIPTIERVSGFMHRLEQVEVAFSGKELVVHHPRLTFDVDQFEGKLLTAGESFTLQDFSGQFWGGTVLATASLRRTEPHWYCEGSVEVKNANIQRRYRQGTHTSGPPADSDPLAGWLSGDFAFRGGSQADSPFTGTGSLAVRRGRLWELPFFVGVRTLLKLPPDASTSPQEFRCVFTADCDKLSIPRLDLTNDWVRMVGKGVAYYSGSVDVEFVVHVRDPKARPDPFVEGIRGIFGDSGLATKYRVAVTGDIGSPEAVMEK